MICGNEVQVPADLNFGKFILNHLRNSNPDHVCMVNAESEEQMTYKEFTHYTVSLAASLVELGVKRGDSVGVGSEKRLTFLPTGLAVVFTGAAYTPFDLEIGRAVLKHQLSLTKLKYFICSSTFWKAYCSVLKDLEHIKTFICFDEDEDIELSIRTLITRQSGVDEASFEPAPVQGQTDTALILYSSGTTGMPKGVQITHLNCIVHCSYIGNQDKENGKSLHNIFVCGAWTSSYEIFMIYKYLSAGRKIVYVDAISTINIFKGIENYQVNILVLEPSTVNPLSKANEVDKYDISSLKLIYCAGSPLRKELMEETKKRFRNLENFLQIYGATEIGEVASEMWGTKGLKQGSVGMAAPSATIKIVDPKTRQNLGPNQSGEICVRGPNVMKGYINIDPSKYLDEQGFFLTGDLGYHDEDDYLFIIGRLKDIISYDGWKIAPVELETVLQLHPDVREAAVVGRPVAEDLGEEPAAFVVRQPAAAVSEQELQLYVSKEMAPHMQLRGGVYFVSELPRNQRGKILRRRLREMLM